MSHVATSAWREKIADQIERNARGLSGPMVARALRQVSDDVYSAGLDAAFSELRRKRSAFGELAVAWDLVWMSVLAVRLAGMRPRRPR